VTGQLLCMGWRDGKLSLKPPLSASLPEVRDERDGNLSGGVLCVLLR